MKSLKESVLAVLTVALLFSMAACGGKKSGPAAQPSAAVRQGSVSYTTIPFLSNYDQYRYDGEINILYLVSTTRAEYFVNSYAVFEPALKAQGINMDLLGPPLYSDESYLGTLESALQTREYDLIVVYPITPQAIAPFVDIAWDTYKTPLLAYAFSPETGCGHYYLSTSYYEEGVTLATSIVEYVNDNAAYFNALKTIPVAVFANYGAGAPYQRIAGALDVLKADGRFSVLEEYEANGDAACLAATETVLTTYPDVEVILTQIDLDIPGAYQAVTSGNYKCSEYLSVYGFGAYGFSRSLMYEHGVDGFVQGSAFIDHEQACGALGEIIPILVGAAKQGIIIEFTPEEKEEMATLFGGFCVTVTPKNVRNYYTPE
jgi:ABC-type sugar transport system substrate-binding protein